MDTTATPSTAQCKQTSSTEASLSVCVSGSSYANMVNTMTPTLVDLDVDSFSKCVYQAGHIEYIGCSFKGCPKRSDSTLRIYRSLLYGEPALVDIIHTNGDTETRALRLSLELYPGCSSSTIVATPRTRSTKKKTKRPCIECMENSTLYALGIKTFQSVVVNSHGTTYNACRLRGNLCMYNDPIQSETDDGFSLDYETDETSPLTHLPNENDVFDLKFVKNDCPVSRCEAHVTCNGHMVKLLVRMSMVAPA